MASESPPITEEKTDLHDLGEREEEQYPCLQVVEGPVRGARYPLYPGKNLIGRSELADVSLDDSSVSREHAELDVREEGALVHDLGSRNGTEVQGQRITSDTPITQGGRLKVGVYDFQYLTGPAELPAEDAELQEEKAEETAVEEEVAEGTETVAEEGAEGTEGEEEAEEVPEEEAEEAQPPAEIPEEAAEEEVPKPSLVQRFKMIPLKGRLLGGLGLVTLLIVVGAFFFWPGGPGVPPELPTAPGVGPSGQAVSGVVKLPVPEYVPVFLDFSSSPIQADVFFGEEIVGTTPFRMSAHLQYAKMYEVKALFKLKDIGETLTEKHRFSLGMDQQVIPIKFAGPIGHMKVKSLPRSVDLYLEAHFVKDPHRAKPIKFNEVIFGKPTYLPYGRYSLELKQSRQLSSSKTFISDVIYRREFVIDKDNKAFTLNVREKDLKIFPAEIKSAPEGAEVLVDDKLLGTTPFKGDLTIGEHKLVLRKEGYFEHEQEIRVDLNASFKMDITLKTSKAGKLINDARIRMKQRRYHEAIHSLVESLKHKPTTQEIAEAHYLIGQTYLYLGSYDEAEDYLTQAMRHELFRYPARLGIAQIYFNKKERIRALQVLVEVLLSAKRDEVRSNAGKLFQQISPFKSVLYITTEPVAASVVVNDKLVSVKTPLILHDLMVGVYRLHFSLPGYEPQMAKIDLGVSEFKPVVVKLMPVKPVQ